MKTTAAQVMARDFTLMGFAGKVESCPHGYEEDCPLCSAFDAKQVRTVDEFCEERELTVSPSKKAQALRAILEAQ